MFKLEINQLFITVKIVIKTNSLEPKNNGADIHGNIFETHRSQY